MTFGCRLNAYESEVIKRHAQAAGLEHTVVVNTCAVTAEAVAQARQAIRKAARARPGAAIVVTGWGAAAEPAPVGDLPESAWGAGKGGKVRRSAGVCRP